MAFRKKSILLNLLFSVLFTLVCILLVNGIPMLLTRVPSNPFASWTGGSWLGHRLAYIGTVLILTSQFYNILKLVGVRHPRLFKLAKTTLPLHCVLSSLGSVMILIHSDFPFNQKYFRLSHYILVFRGGVSGLIGTAQITALLVFACFVSGLFGNLIYPRLDLKWRIRLRLWRPAHTLLSLLLYSLLIIHLIVVVGLRIISG